MHLMSTLFWLSLIFPTLLHVSHGRQLLQQNTGCITTPICKNFLQIITDGSYTNLIKIEPYIDGDLSNLPNLPIEELYMDSAV